MSFSYFWIVKAVYFHFPQRLETKHLAAQCLLISKNTLSVETPLAALCKHKKIIPVILPRFSNLANGTQQIPASAASTVVGIINTKQSLQEGATGAAGVSLNC